MDEIKTFDFTSEGGITQFGIEMEEALAMGEERLREYLPIIKRMQEAMKEALTPKTAKTSSPAFRKSKTASVSTIFRFRGAVRDRQGSRRRSLRQHARASVKQNIIGALIEGFTQGALLILLLLP